MKKSSHPEKIQGPTHINRTKSEMKIRNSPRILSQLIDSLTEEQREWVKDAGFESLLEFDLVMIPTKLAYNVFQIFEHNSVSLKLKDEAIPIVEEDVFDVLGIPHGGARIILGSQEKHKARIDAWLSQFDTNHITVSMIADLMKNQPVSDNFKLNFLIVMSNVLIETPTHSYVERQLLRFDDSLDNCCNYNWAEYLINSLVLGTQSWNRNSSTFFTGPMIFLILFYVDRVRHKGIKLVDRRFPSYKGWTEKALKERQRIEVIDGVFGIGSILPPLREVLSEDSQPLPNASPSKDNWDDWNHNKPANDWDKHINKSDRDKTNVDDVPQVDIMDTDEPNDENEDPAERLRKRAQNLIEEKMLFDTDLKIELDKDPQNYTLQTIATVIEDVFQINCYHYPPTKPARQSTPPTREINNIDEDFELTIQETDHIDLVDYIQSIQRTNESLQQQNRDLQFVPSFSLGIEDNIIHQFPSLDEKKMIHQRFSIFTRNMEDILKKTERNKLDNIDMVFFPIHKYDHFYLIIYHIKKGAYEIIDNINRDENEDICYGEVPGMLNAQESQITKLRVKYNTAILAFHLNEKKDSILKEAKELFNKVAEKKMINVLRSSTKSNRTNTNQKKSVSFALNLNSHFEDVATEK
ncbi:hypothetical protein DCAR_0312479 [Daucus carota subsp. sativus]|uniref:Ubiquitin-like protease family profile domain-containing protein n=1 Tax=Daucus carota subsp. sativus TaxID=79200 RepID=A0AAF0WRK1_DAUCS|nr:hypothetical protein DCAR_0312479 [Daucus carota subsp. sativus]